MDYLQQLIERYPKLIAIKSNINDAFRLLVDTFEADGKLLLAGNGGSAADCDHIVGELMKSFVKKRVITDNKFLQNLKSDCATDIEAADYLSKNLAKGLASINLCSQTALNTAVINDVGADIMFAQSVCAYGEIRDAFLGISTSGNAKNIYYAMLTAKAKGLSTIALTGNTGGKIAKIADVAIVVPEKETYKIQELHLPVYHTLCLALEEYFFV